MADFKVRFASYEFLVKFSSDDTKVRFGETQTVSIGDEIFNGEYTVTPKVEAQTMPTKQKVMTDDVTVLAIPYAEVTNVSNGKTVTIG